MGESTILELQISDEFYWAQIEMGMDGKIRIHAPNLHSTMRVVQIVLIRLNDYLWLSFHNKSDDKISVKAHLNEYGLIIRFFESHGITVLDGTD